MYDRIAEKYAAAFAGRGRVCDGGCGPGHVGGYLAARGVDVFGLDLSPRMVELARRLNPGIPFELGDMLALALPDTSLAGIAAFYSLIHLARDTVARALGELGARPGPGRPDADRVPRGLGPGPRGGLVRREGLDARHALRPDEMRGYLEAAGFAVDDVTARDPYDFEYPTRRVYAVATKRG